MPIFSKKTGEQVSEASMRPKIGNNRPYIVACWNCGKQEDIVVVTDCKQCGAELSKTKKFGYKYTVPKGFTIEALWVQGHYVAHDQAIRNNSLELVNKSTNTYKVRLVNGSIIIKRDLQTVKPTTNKTKENL